MATFKEFLEGTLQPTAKETQWATQNFSSRVDPPTDTDDLIIHTNPGDPFDLTVPSDPSNVKDSLLPDQEVFERGLVDMGGGGEGDDRERVNAYFSVVARKGISSLKVEDQTFTSIQIQNFASVNGVVVTDKGTLTLLETTVITSNEDDDPTHFAVRYEYLLTATINNQTVVPTGKDSNDQSGYNECLTLVATDVTGKTYSDNLIFHIVNDVPEAFSDGIHIVTEDGTSFVSGSVMNNDQPGADVPLSFVGWSDSNAANVASLNIYGVLILNHSTGDWSYTLDNTRPATQALTEADVLLFELFYTIMDNDGDTADGSVSIRIIGTYDEPLLPCTVPTVGDYLSKPATLLAHMSVLTVNMDPTDYTITDAMNWTHRATPLSWGAARPARMFPINLSALTSDTKGGFIAITDVNSASPAIIRFNGASVFNDELPTAFGTYLTFALLPGTSPVVGIAGAIVATLPFVIPAGNTTQVMWGKIGATTFTFNNSENYFDTEADGWIQIFHMTTQVEYMYACYDLEGNSLYYEVTSTTVNYDTTYNVGLSNQLEPQYAYDNSTVASRKPIELNVNNIVHSADIQGVCALPPTNVMPRLTQWPLHEGLAGDSECFRDYNSADGTTLWLSEALTPPPNGNLGAMAVGHRVAIKEVGSLVTVRFYPNREDVLGGLVPDTEDVKQLMLCHSSQPFTGTGFTSGSDPHPPQLISNPIPSSVAMLKTTPVSESDIEIHGAGLGAHLPMEIGAGHWGSGAVLGGDSTEYPYIRLTFQRVS